MRYQHQQDVHLCGPRLALGHIQSSAKQITPLPLSNRLPVVERRPEIPVESFSDIHVHFRRLTSHEVAVWGRAVKLPTGNKPYALVLNDFPFVQLTSR